MRRKKKRLRKLTKLSADRMKTITYYYLISVVFSFLGLLVKDETMFYFFLGVMITTNLVKYLVGIIRERR